MDGFLWEHLFYGLRDQYVQFDILVFTSVIWVSFSMASSSKLSSLRFPVAFCPITLRYTNAIEWWWEVARTEITNIPFAGIWYSGTYSRNQYISGTYLAIIGFTPLILTYLRKNNA